MTVSADRPATLGDLKASGYRSVPVKTELRRNLLRKLKSGDDVFPGILGYEATVFPQLYNAVLSKHDVLLLGLRGQGKTRMLRLLTQLLDEAIPAVAGSEIHDDPLAPLSKYSRDLIAEKGDDTPIVWVGREERYNEKLATPDVTIADLIGEVDLIKHAGGALLSSEDAMHFGLIPRSHRGIFCMNELPDLAPKIQVGLFNVLEERDVQIRGFNVRLPLDLMCVFSANPEDYTNRGRIVTPLKDRIGTVVRTHYPATAKEGIEIAQENAWLDRDQGPAASGVEVVVPPFMQLIVEEVVRLARKSPHVSQASGVSVRTSIANLETVVSNAERRGLITGEDRVVTRMIDLQNMVASSRGKVEMSMAEDDASEDKLIGSLIGEATKGIFDAIADPDAFEAVVDQFQSNMTFPVGDDVGGQEFADNMKQVTGLSEGATAICKNLNLDESDPQMMASAGEFLLEGLYVNNRLSKFDNDGRSFFKR